MKILFEVIISSLIEIPYIKTIIKYTNDLSQIMGKKSLPTLAWL